MLTTLDEQASVASFDYEPMPPILREDNRIQEITSIEDLIFLASQILDSNELYHFDLFLNALVEWNEQLEAKHITQWTPVLQRAYKLLYQWRKFTQRNIGFYDGNVPYRLRKTINQAVSL